MSLPFPEPTGPALPRADVFLAYLDYFRSLIVRKLQGLSEDQLRTTALPSGWTVLELAKHLTYVERRWLVRGFEGRPVAEPWGVTRGTDVGMSHSRRTRSRWSARCRRRVRSAGPSSALTDLATWTARRAVGRR